MKKGAVVIGVILAAVAVVAIGLLIAGGLWMRAQGGFGPHMMMGRWGYPRPMGHFGGGWLLALVLLLVIAGAVALLVVGLRVTYTKKLVGTGTFTFDDVAGMRAAVERAAASDEPQAFAGRSVGRDAGGEVVAEFEIAWSFKRRCRP